MHACHACMHACTHTCTRMHTRVHTRMHACMHATMHTYTRTHSLIAGLADWEPTVPLGCHCFKVKSNTRYLQSIIRSNLIYPQYKGEPKHGSPNTGYKPATCACCVCGCTSAADCAVDQVTPRWPGLKRRAGSTCSIRSELISLSRALWGESAYRDQSLQALPEGPLDPPSRCVSSCWPRPET